MSEITKNIKRVGFIGLGIMGAPMAANCLKAGFELKVYNRTASKTAALEEAGAGVAGSPAALANACDVVITCVTNTADVLEVVLTGEAPVIDGAHEGLVVIDCSTVSPKVAVQCGESLGGAGARFLDAPISGGDVGAQAGTLSIMVGGRREDFDRAAGVLNAMGETITYCGPAGAGYTVKLCNQILGGLHLVAAAEAISLASAAGVDCQAMLQAVSAGAAGSWMLTNLARR